MAISIKHLAQALFFMVRHPSEAIAAVRAEAEWQGYLRKLSYPEAMEHARRVLLETGADEIVLRRMSATRREQLDRQAAQANRRGRSPFDVPMPFSPGNNPGTDSTPPSSPSSPDSTTRPDESA
jgi:hypothetical protein